MLHQTDGLKKKKSKTILLSKTKPNRIYLKFFIISLVAKKLLKCNLVSASVCYFSEFLKMNKIARKLIVKVPRFLLIITHYIISMSHKDTSSMLTLFKVNNIYIKNKFKIPADISRCCRCFPLKSQFCFCLGIFLVKWLMHKI